MSVSIFLVCVYYLADFVDHFGIQGVESVITYRMLSYRHLFYMDNLSGMSEFIHVHEKS
jgi:hypothetical protein